MTRWQGQRVSAGPLAGNGVAPDDAVPVRRGQSGRAAARLHDPWRVAFFALLVLAVLAAGGWALLDSKLLAVRHVEVTGDRLVSAGQVRRVAAIAADTPLARVDTVAVARRVEQIPAVLSATVSRSWPDTIVITVRERTAVLAVSGNRGYWLIDAHGVTVRWAARKPAGMPLLMPATVVHRGSKAVRAAAAVLRSLPPGLRVRVISVAAPRAGAVTLSLDGGITVLWGGQGMTAQKLTELSLLMQTHAHYYDVSDPGTVVTQR